MAGLIDDNTELVDASITPEAEGASLTEFQGDRSPADFDDDDFEAFMTEMEGDGGQVDDDDDFEAFMTEIEGGEEEQIGPKKKTDAEVIVERANRLMDGSEGVKENVATKRLAMQLRDVDKSLSLEDAYNIVDSIGAEEYLLQKDASYIATMHPALAGWAEDPYNRALLKREPDKLKRLELLVSAIAPNKSDFGRAFDKTWLAIPRLTAITKEWLGLASKEETAKALEEVHFKSMVPYTPETESSIRASREAKKEMATAAAKLHDYLGGVAKSFGEEAVRRSEKSKTSRDPYITLDDLKSFATVMKETASGTWDILKGFAGWASEGTSSFKAEAIEQTESLVSTATAVIPYALGSGAGKIATKMGKEAATVVASKLAGGASGYAINSSLEFEGKVAEYFQEFTDEDGKIDFDAALNDPRYEKIREGAVVYGALKGGSDLVVGKILGGKAVAPTKKVASAGVAKTIGKTAAAGAKGAVKEGLQTAATGSTGVLLATQLADAYMGQETDVEAMMEKAVGEFFGYGVMGGMAGGPKGSGLYVAQRFQEANYQRWKKANEEKSKNITKAFEDLVAIKQLQEDIKGLDPEAARELINKTMEDNTAMQEAQALMEDVDRKELDRELDPSAEAPFEDPAKLDSREVEAVTKALQEEAARENLVKISPREFREILEDNNISLAEAKEILPENIFKKLAVENPSDTYITMDLFTALEIANSIPDIETTYILGENAYSGKQAALGYVDMRRGFNADGVVVTGEVVTTLQGEENIKKLEALQEERKEKLGEEADTELQEITGTPPEGSEEVTPDNLISIEEAFKDDTVFPSDSIDINPTRKTNIERRIYGLMVNDMKQHLKAVGNTRITQGAIEAVAEFELSRLRARSEALEISMRDLYENERIKTVRFKGRRSNDTRGFFSPSTFEVHFTQHADPGTMVHELGHSWLQEMALDYHAVLKDINPEKMTEGQHRYMEALRITAEEIGEGMTVDEMVELILFGELGSTDGEYSPLRKLHERFALTTEKYFLDGEHENSKIKFIMERFKKFLIQFIEDIGTAYADIGIFPKKITPEVERLFEYLLDLDHATKEATGHIFDEIGFDFDMLGKDARDFGMAIEKANNIMIADLTNKLATKSYRERERAINKLLDGIYDEVNKELDESPAGRLSIGYEGMVRDWADQRAAFKAEGNKVGDFPVLDPRLSRNELKELLGEAEFDRLIADKKIPGSLVSNLKEKASSVDMMMRQANIRSRKQLKQLILEAANRDEIMQDMVNKKVKEKNPIIKTDADIYKEVMMAISNEGEDALMRARLKAMDKKALLKGGAGFIAPNIRGNIKLMKETAESSMAFDDYTTFTFKNLSKEYESRKRDAADFWKKGDFESAANEMYNAEIVRLKLSQAARVEKTAANIAVRVARVKSKLRVGDKHYSPEVLRHLLAMHRAYTEGDIIPKMSIESFPPGLGITPDHVLFINGIAEALEFNRNYYSKDQHTVTVGQMLVLDKALAEIQKQAFSLMAMEVNGEKVIIEDMKRKVNKEIKASRSPVDDFRTEKGEVPMVRLLLNSFKSATVKLEAALDSLYESKEAWVNSDMHEVFNGVVQAEARADLIKNEIFSELGASLTEVLKVLHKKNPMLMKALPQLYRIPGAFTQAEVLKSVASKTLNLGDYFPAQMETLADGTQAPRTFNNKVTNQNYVSQGLKFDSVFDYLLAELLMGSESGAKKLLFGGVKDSGPLVLEGPTVEATEANFQEGIRKWNAMREELVKQGVLTKEMFDFVHNVWRVMDRVHPDAVAARRNVLKQGTGKIGGWKVNTPFGEYEGGYYPVTVEKTNELGTKLIPDHKGGSVSEELYISKKDKHYSERTESYNPLDLNFKGLVGYINSAVDVGQLLGPLTLFRRMVLGHEFRRLIEEKRPGLVENVIEPWFERVSRQMHIRKSEGPTDKAIEKIRDAVIRDTNMVQYAGNITAPLSMVAGVTQPLGHVNTVSWLQSLAHHVRYTFRQGNDSSPMTFALSRSKVLQTQLQSVHKSVIRDTMNLDLDYDWASRGSKFAREVAPYFIMQPSQMFASAVTWNSAYNSYVKGNPTHSESQAIKYADNILQATQGTSGVSQNVELLANGWARMFLLGGAKYVVDMYNGVRTEVKRRPEMYMRVWEFLRYAPSMIVFPGVVSTALWMLNNGRDDEELEIDGAWYERPFQRAEARLDQKSEELAKFLALQMMDNTLPFSGKLLDILVMSRGKPMNPSSSLVMDMVRSPFALYNEVAKEKPMTKSELNALLRSVQMMAPWMLPVVFSKYPIRTIFEDDVLEGLLDFDFDDRMKERRRTIIEERKENEGW